MAKKTLKEKIDDVAFWTVIFLILYLIIGYLLESLWLSKPLKLDELYELLKDGFSITAAFLAPVAAFILFSDWREQHNKQVRNEFALKVFTQFEALEKEIHEAGMILIEMEHLVPYESQNRFSSDRRPIYLNDKLFKDNGDLILSFNYKIDDIQEVFNILLDKIRYFGIATSQLIEVTTVAFLLLEKFKEINIKNEDDTYSEYLKLLDVNSKKLEQYYELRNMISDLIITDLLKTFQAD